MITGGCLCGGVRYETGGEPLLALFCHCRDCQRTSGTGHVPVLGVARHLLKVIGTTSSYAVVGGSKLKAVRHFCPVCGSLLFGTPEAAPHIATIYVGSLDDPTLFKPGLVQFTRDRLPWDKTTGDLPEFETAAADAGRTN